MPEVRLWLPQHGRLLDAPYGVQGEGSVTDDDEVSASAQMIIAIFVGAAFGFAIAYWVWPWLGPQMFQPCPQFTSLGIGIYCASKAFQSVGLAFKSRKEKRTERRLARLEARR